MNKNESLILGQQCNILKKSNIRKKNQSEEGKSALFLHLCSSGSIGASKQQILKCYVPGGTAINPFLLCSGFVHVPADGVEEGNSKAQPKVSD